MKDTKTKKQNAVPTASGIPVYCVHSGIVAIGSLKPNAKNPNRHPARQIERLALIIRAQGWRAPITVSNRSGLIVRGHCRLEAAKLLEVSEVPIDRQDYASDAEEMADLIADNQIAELAETDFGLMADALGEIDTGDFDMSLTGFDEKELEDMMTWTAEETVLKSIKTDPPPPAMAWVLIGIPTVRFGEIAGDVDRIAALPGAVVETSVTSE